MALCMPETPERQSRRSPVDRNRCMRYRHRRDRAQVIASDCILQICAKDSRHAQHIMIRERAEETSITSRRQWPHRPAVVMSWTPPCPSGLKI